MSDPEQWSAARLLVTAGRLVENAYNAQLAGLGITHAGMTVLAVLAARGALRQIQLADELKVQTQTMGKMLERLARKGFVSRTPRSPDRHRQLIIISPAGQDVLVKAQAIEDKLRLTQASRGPGLRNHLKKLIRAYG
jgi:DNA-binding MarR family transcriptional regulator